MKESFNRWICEFVWERCEWDTLPMVNPLVHEDLQRRGSRIALKSVLLPDPAPDALTIECAEARDRLGLPNDDPYIGFDSMMGQRKAVPELCNAYASSGLAKDPDFCWRVAWTRATGVGPSNSIHRS